MSIRKTNLPLFLLIGTGGALGAASRYGVSFVTLSDGFPYATIIVNLIGCFLLAYVSNSSMIKNIIPASILVAISTGFIGSFTTFSTVSVETISLWDSSLVLGLLYIFIQIVGGLFFCFIGYKLALGRRNFQ